MDDVITTMTRTKQSADTRRERRGETYRKQSLKRTRRVQAFRVFCDKDVAFIWTDHAGVITDVTSAWGSITGFDASDCIGKRPSMFQCDLTTEKSMASMRRAMEAREKFSGTIVNRKKDGTLYTVNLDIVPVPSGFVGRLSNIHTFT